MYMLYFSCEPLEPYLYSERAQTEHKAARNGITSKSIEKNYEHHCDECERWWVKR